MSYQIKLLLSLVTILIVVQGCAILDKVNEEIVEEALMNSTQNMVESGFSYPTIGAFALACVTYAVVKLKKRFSKHDSKINVFSKDANTENKLI